MGFTPGHPFSRWFLALVAALLLLMILAAAGCGGADDGTATTTTAAATTAAPTTIEPTTTTTEAPEPFAMGIALAPGMGDWVEVPVLAGAERVSVEYPAEVTIAGSADLAGDLRQLAAASDLVLVVGQDYNEPLVQVALEYPEILFVCLDGGIEAPNVVSASFSMQEAAFLVGAAAALTTETGQVAFLGAMPIGSITRLEAGFRAGALAADPDVEVGVDYLGEAGAWALFNDPEAARLAALDLYGAGVDVIFQGTGASGSGVFTAAVETRAVGTNVWAIGVDTDQAASADADIAPVILTSAVFDYEAAVLWAAAEFAADRLIGGEVGLGVAAGVVGYTTTGGWVDAIADDLETFAAGIADGSIVVPHQP